MLENFSNPSTAHVTAFLGPRIFSIYLKTLLVLLPLLGLTNATSCGLSLDSRAGSVLTGHHPKERIKPLRKSHQPVWKLPQLPPLSRDTPVMCWSPLTPACKSSHYIFRSFVSQWLNSNSYYWKFKYISIKLIILKQGNKYSSVSLPNDFTRFDYYLCS